MQLLGLEETDLLLRTQNQNDFCKQCNARKSSIKIKS